MYRKWYDKWEDFRFIDFYPISQSHVHKYKYYVFFFN